MIISVKARIPQTESLIYSGSFVKMPAKAEGRKRETRNMKVVKPMHRRSTQRTIRRMRSWLPAP